MDLTNFFKQVDACLFLAQGFCFAQGCYFAQGFCSAQGCYSAQGFCSAQGCFPARGTGCRK